MNLFMYERSLAGPHISVSRRIGSLARHLQAMLTNSVLTLKSLRAYTLMQNSEPCAKAIPLPHELAQTHQITKEKTRTSQSD